MDDRYLYLVLNLAAISIPVILSFDKKVRFYRTWPSLFPAIAIMAVGFLAWDIAFTARGVWGFNPRYLTGKSLFGLPLSEYLFFITVPYACTFIYVCVRAYRFDRFARPYLRYVYWVVILVAIALNVFFAGGIYTITVGALSTVIAAGLLVRGPSFAPALALTFVISLLPFLIMNGILTGSWIAEPVVSYNTADFSGIRIGTIPLEDVLYAFSLIAGTVILMEYLGGDRRD